MSIFKNTPKSPKKRFVLNLDLGRDALHPELQITAEHEGNTESEIAEIKAMLQSHKDYSQIFGEFLLIGNFEEEFKKPKHISPFLTHYNFNVIPVSVSSSLAENKDPHYTYTIDILPMNITLVMNTIASFNRVDTFMRKLHDLFMEADLAEKQVLAVA